MRLDKVIKNGITFPIPEFYVSGTKDIIIPDNHTPINGDTDFILVTDSMVQESNTNKYLEHYFIKKGANICSDIFAVTGNIFQQETTINFVDPITNESLGFTGTATLSKKRYNIDGYTPWVITTNIKGEIIDYCLPERLIQFNQQKNRSRVDLNRAGLVCILQSIGVNFKNKSNEQAFKKIKIYSHYDIQEQN